jgi:hypothetical protein
MVTPLVSQSVRDHRAHSVQSHSYGLLGSFLQNMCRHNTKEVTSLSSHLVCMIQEVCSFFASINYGSHDINALWKDLEIIRSILEQLQIEAQFYDEDLRGTTLQALNAAHSRLEELHSIVSQVGASFSSHSHPYREHRPSMKRTVDDKIESFRKPLRNTTVALLAACQISQA